MIDTSLPKPKPPVTFIVVPKLPPGRKLVRPMFVPGEIDPIRTREKKPITLSSTFLSAVITLYTCYATGYLPEADALFNRIDTYLRSQNDVIVNVILAAAPYIGMVLFCLAVTAYFLLQYNRIRRRASRVPRAA